MLDLSAHETAISAVSISVSVGGTNVSHVNGTLVDIENDLKGINRPSTKCPGFNFLPLPTEASRARNTSSLKKITGNEMIETSLKKFIESNMKWVSNKANIHVSKDGRKRIDDYKGKEYQNVIVANPLLMLLLNALVTRNDEIVAFERFEAIMHA
eukprot:gene3044-13064_t